MKKLLSLILSAVVITTCFIGIVPAFGASTTVEDGVVTLEDKQSGVTRYVLYPEDLKTANKKYPVIVWANGTGCQPTLYTDLFKGFVKQGYIVVASSETMAADGKDQIAGLDYIVKKSKSSKDTFYNKVYTNKITAMGHSQGGRSAVNAAAADVRFACVVSIAGSNYQDEAALLKAPVLFFTGTNDSIVSSSKWVQPAYDVCKGAAVYASLIGARHTTCSSEPDKYISYSVSWMKAWTGNDNTALSVFKAGGVLANDESWCDVQRKNLTNNISGKIELSASTYAYNGKVKKPSVKVKAYNGSVISADNYTVTYDKGRKNIGKYKVTVKYKGLYTGSKSVYFSIVPKGTSIKKLTSAKAGFKVNWTKQATQTTGYQIQYSTSSKFSKPKTVTVPSNKTTSKTVSKLSKLKKYYVRIRTYKTVGKTKYYSSWSKSKTVTTAK